MKEDVIKLYKLVCKYVFNDIPARAIISLREMILKVEKETSKDLSILVSMLETEETNLNMLYLYAIEKNLQLDNNLFTKIKSNLLSLADKTKSSMYSDVFQEKDFRKFRSNISVISEYYKAKKLSEVLCANGINSSSSCDIKQRDKATIELFEFIKAAFYLTEDESLEVIDILKGDVLKEREKALIVSALMLSLIKEFDEYKVKILLSIANQGMHVLVRAKVAILLVSYLYNERLKLYDDLYGALHREFESNRDFYVDIYLQLLRSKYTSKSSSVLNDLANSISNDSNISKKIVDNKLLIDDEDALFSKVSDKISGYIDKQNNGEDVNFSTQLFLQNESFFTAMYSFFLPFSLEESFIYDEYGEITKENETNFFFIYSNTYLCDVDKFHTLLSLKKVNNMLEKAMENVPKDIILPFDKVELKLKDLLRNYIFNLYRFYYYCLSANSYKNPFLSSLQMYKLDFFNNLSKDNINTVTNLYYENGAYDDIVGIITINEKVCNNEIFMRKRGLSLYRLAKYADALIDLENANLVHERSSTMITLSDCYYEIGNKKKALECLENALKISDSGYKNKIRLVELYIDLNKEQEALDTLNYLDYELSESLNNLEDLERVRGIFMNFDRSMIRKHIESGNTLKSNEYIEHLRSHFASYMNEEDHILSAHFILASDGYKKAKHCYLSATKSAEVLCKCFELDKTLLLSLGIAKEKQLLYLNDILLSMN